MEKDDLIALVNVQTSNIDQLKWDLSERDARIEQLEAEVTVLKAEIAVYRGDARHQIELREDGFTIQHPLACRPNLFDCVYNQLAREDFTEPPKELGRFYLEFDGADLTVGERVLDGA